MADFDVLWREILKRHIITVQDYDELKYVFNLIRGCKSYLEVGTAEGNSLYILAHALDQGANITYVDYGERHTKSPRDEVLAKIPQTVTGIHGDSNDPVIIERAKGKYEAVLIDAGHSYRNVITDALSYGPMATKYIMFHDVQLPDVDRAFKEYCAMRPECRNYRVVNSEHFGYGIMEIA